MTFLSKLKELVTARSTETLTSTENVQPPLVLFYNHIFESPLCRIHPPNFDPKLRSPFQYPEIGELSVKKLNPRARLVIETRFRVTFHIGYFYSSGWILKSEGISM